MRTMVTQRKCGEHAAYRYVVATAAGRVCCVGDDPVHVCAECRRAVASSMPKRTPADALHLLCKDAEDRSIPSPPSLRDRILAGRGQQPAAAPRRRDNTNGIPAPPSLADRITAARAREAAQRSSGK